MLYKLHAGSVDTESHAELIQSTLRNVLTKMNNHVKDQIIGHLPNF